MSLDASDYFSAGFFLTRKFPRPEWAAAHLLPECLVSASGCLADFIPDTWCLAWTGDSPEFRQEKAASFGLTEAALKALTDFVTAVFEHEIGWPNICYELTTALHLAWTFLQGRDDVLLLEIGLHHSLVEGFCRAAEPPPPEPGYAPWGRQGVHETLLKNRPVLAGGTPLGLEPLVFDRSLSDSWLCNSLERPVREVLGISPNAHGLLATFAEAIRVVDYISRPDVGAEPGLWLPWLLLVHEQEG